MLCVFKLSSWLARSARGIAGSSSNSCLCMLEILRSTAIPCVRDRLRCFRYCLVFGGMRMCCASDCSSFEFARRRVTLAGPALVIGSIEKCKILPARASISHDREFADTGTTRTHSETTAQMKSSSRNGKRPDDRIQASAIMEPTRRFLRISLSSAKRCRSFGCAATANKLSTNDETQQEG